MTTKKEFLAKILEVGKGKPIDTSTFAWDKGQLEKEWAFVQPLDALLLSQGPRSIWITNLSKTNPPKNEIDIVFESMSGTRLINIDTIPDAFAEDIIKLIYKPNAKQFVILPYSAKEALHGLQKDEEGIEWGGGIDFEIVKGRAQIERILAYYAEKWEIPSRIIRKYKKDVEVQFHTHPSQALAIPSIEDIVSFINSSQQMEFIAAGEEILILEKTRNTPKVTNSKLVESQLSCEWKTPSDKPEQLKMLKRLDDEYKIRTTVIPYSKDTTIININVIKGEKKK